MVTEAPQRRRADSLHAPARSTRMSSALGLIGVLGFLVPGVLYLWLIDHYAINAIRADQWNDIQIVGASLSGKLSLSALWALHYENRIFFPNLIVVLLGKTTHFNVLVEEYLSAVLAFLSVGILVWAHRRRAGTLRLLWYCPVAIVMWSIVQHQNTLWGFQLAWYLVLFCLIATLAVLDRPKLSRPLLALATAVAIVGSYSSLQGLLIWPAGLLVLYLRRRPVAHLVGWAGVAIATAILYFYNYVVPAGENGYAIRHPWASAEFFLVEIGDVVGVNVVQADAEGIVVMLVGLAMVLTSVWALINYGRRDRVIGGSPIALALIVFGLIFAGVVTEGRVSLGLSGASSSRYRTFDLLIVAGLYLLALDELRVRRLSRVATTAELDRSAAMPVGLDRDTRSDSDTGPGTAKGQIAPQGALHRAGVVTGLAVALLAIVVAIGIPEGLAGARSDHAAQVRAARVSVNIEKYPTSFVNIAESEFLSARFLKKMDRIAIADHLSLFGTGDAARYRAEGLIVDTSTPKTSIGLPVNGSVLKGSPLLSATASDYFGVSKVEFEVSGQGVHDMAVSEGKAYQFGWLGQWRTTEVPNGRYTLESIAFNAAGRWGRSASVAVVVDN